MKIKTILKSVGSLHLLLGVLLINLLIFSADTIAPSVSAETLLFIRGTADVVAATNIGIVFLLIISSSIRDDESAKKVFSWVGIMLCLLIVAVFNTLNARNIVDAGPPSPFWVVLIANPVLCTYGSLKS